MNKTLKQQFKEAIAHYEVMRTMKREEDFRQQTEAIFRMNCLWRQSSTKEEHKVLEKR